MTEGNILTTQLVFQVLAIDAGLNTSGEGARVDLQHAVHATHVETNDHAARLVMGL